MIDGKRILAVIPARGGSKGLPRKNVLDAGGKPLLVWSVEAGRASAHVDRVVLSSEDPEIQAVARSVGCDVVERPAHMAEDDSGIVDVMLHALDASGEDYEYVVMLHPTAPLRLPEDIDGCVARCHTQRAPACVTVAEAGKPPEWMFYVDADHRMRHVMPKGSFALRRQELEQSWSLNGAVYVARVSWFREAKTWFSDETLAYPMPKQRSLDVDTMEDMTVVRALLAYRSAPVAGGE